MGKQVYHSSFIREACWSGGGIKIVIFRLTLFKYGHIKHRKVPRTFDIIVMLLEKVNLIFSYLSEVYLDFHQL